ncbi:MAG: serine hydrolase domain-containing protein [Burkholderiaceae bacterium]
MNEKLQRALQGQLNRWQFFGPCPGTNMSIVDSVLGSWSGSSGCANVDTTEAMRPHALCYIYSITKTFTAIRILQLAEKGIIGLDESIAHYLPALSQLPTIRIRELLNHTSGIPSYTDLPNYIPANRADPSNPWSYDHVLELTCQGKLDFPPGKGWHYSNTGYMFLQRLIEMVTKKTYADNVAENIAKPLGLHNTYVATNIDAGKITPGYCPYLNELEVMENVMPIYHPGWCLTGLIASTTAEIAQLYAALFSEEILNPESLKQLTSWTSCGGGSHPFFVKPGYGLGLMIDPEWSYGGFYGHGGDGPGFNTWAMHLPNFHGRKLTMVVFCNATMGAHPYKLTRNLLRTLEEMDEA